MKQKLQGASPRRMVIGPRSVDREIDDKIHDCIAIAGSSAACVEGTESATAYNSSGGTSTGTVIPRRDGGYALTFSAEGNSCSAVFNNVPPGGTELSPVTCTGTGSGNATMIYAADGSPDRVTFGGRKRGRGRSFQRGCPMAKCLTETVATGANLSLYNTTQSARDVRDHECTRLPDLKRFRHLL